MPKQKVPIPEEENEDGIKESGNAKDRAGA